MAFKAYKRISKNKDEAKRRAALLITHVKRYIPGKWKMVLTGADPKGCYAYSIRLGMIVLYYYEYIQQFEASIQPSGLYGHYRCTDPVLSITVAMSLMEKRALDFAALVNNQRKLMGDPPLLTSHLTTGNVPKKKK